MRVSAEQLPERLRRGALAPVYLLSGDEPLQHGEAAQQVRARAREAGFREREVLEAADNFDWGQLATAAGSLSLFAEKRLIEVRLLTPRIGADGSRAVCALCENPIAETLFLFLAPKLERGQLKSAWVAAVERSGVLVQIWPVEGAALVPWIERRMRSAGLQPRQGAAALLAERVEGNLLAAAQEVEKLALVHGEGPVSLEQVAGQSSDSARFDVFDLADGMLAGELGRLPRILDNLRAEGTASAVVLWAIAREIRQLVQMYPPPGSPAGSQINDRRTAVYRSARARLSHQHLLGLLARCSRIDRMIKGQEVGDEWEALLQLAGEIAGGRPLAPDPTA